MVYFIQIHRKPFLEIAHRLKNHKSYEKQSKSTVKAKKRKSCRPFIPKDGNRADDEDDDAPRKKKKQTDDFQGEKV